MQSSSNPERPASAPRTPGWQQEMARAYTRPRDLLRDLGLPPADVSTAFPMRVPRSFAARMRYGDARDPLLLQVLPIDAENRVVPGFGSDPVGDLASLRDQGLLQKYRGRALLLSTGACAVHCRYCFRRSFPYAEQALRGSGLDQIVTRLAADPDLSEVILSGGDPLSLSDRRLASVLQRLDGLPGLQRVRIHTRLPVVLPTRITDALMRTLESMTRRVIVVLHSNHPQELDEEVAAAAARLAGTGATLLNQAVLLRDVNDNAEALVGLSERLFKCGVLPYYLHQLDPVAGAAHFAVDDARAVSLMREAASRLPGYLVPKLVREIPGAPAKQPLMLEIGAEDAQLPGTSRNG